MKIILKNDLTNLKIKSKTDWVLFLFTCALIFIPYIPIRKGTFLSFEEENRAFLILWLTTYSIVFIICVHRFLWNFFGTIEVIIDNESEQLILKKKLFNFKIYKKYPLNKISILGIEREKNSYIRLGNLTGIKIYGWVTDYSISISYNNQKVKIVTDIYQRDAEQFIQRA